MPSGWLGIGWGGFQGNVGVWVAQGPVSASAGPVVGVADLGGNPGSGLVVEQAQGVEPQVCLTA